MTHGPVPRYNVLGVGVSSLPFDEVVVRALARARERPAAFLTATGVHGLGEARKDSRFRSILNSAWLTVPDGMPLVWLAWLHGHRTATRVYGPDLMLALCDRGRGVGLRHYFYGGVPGVAKLLSEKLAERYPGMIVAGTETPPFRTLTPGELDEFAGNVARSAADVVWVGLSTPKQERFMASIAHSLDAGLMLGVGAAFDFHAGRVRQAPRWIQRSGFEWLYRVAQEPRRLWRRYLVGNTLFIARIALQLTGLRKYPLSPAEADRN